MPRALGHYILVTPDDYVDETKTESGLVVTKSRIEKEGADTGVIYDIGPNAWKSFDDGKPWAQVGDRILFGRYAGYKVVDPDTEATYFVMNDDDIKVKLS
jgi:co-chaperonin GroES (HSP10)